MNTPSDVWKKRKVKEKNLVADQPGSFILFLGIFIALVLGFSLRSFTQSKFLQNSFREIVKNIGPEWETSYEGVTIYLSQGFLPSVGVSINNFTLKSESTCYMSAKVVINEAQIPISFLSLLLYKNPLSELRVKNLKVELANIKPVCDKKKEIETKKTTEVPQKNRISLIDKSSSNESRLNKQLRKISVENIQVSVLDHSLSDFSLSDLVIENKSERPKIVILKTKVDIA
ncbi:MAG: hypothetical protein KDD45_16380, partial [Bdellovibrionales bacterium]|nr:hypothetical protein [Bdellovibrionales bacterium]